MMVSMMIMMMMMEVVVVVVMMMMRRGRPGAQSGSLARRRSGRCRPTRKVHSQTNSAASLSSLAQLPACLQCCG
jgi:hypothetical protein